MINLVKISTKKNSNKYDDKDHPVEKFRAFLNFNKILQGKVANGLLGGSHVKSRKGEERKANKVEANFYRGSQ